MDDALVIDLGYQLNKGQTATNGQLITFRNIRYAAPPTGPLRFLAPVAPSVNRTVVQDASDVICPQAYPKWLTTGAISPFTPADIPPVDPRTSEDCLFLDVLQPRSIWETREKSRAPVLVWIHGGGFDLGWKDASGRGYGLVMRSQQFDSPGVILVSINYRLGLFGWMQGPGVQANAGLLDQEFALEWVRKHIARFGGDPCQVTLLGESAGASSIEAHVTAYGGSSTRRPPLFKGAIAQSPYLLPTDAPPNSQLPAVLRFGNVSSLDALREKPSSDLQTLNALIIGNSRPFGTFTFGIVADGDYVPDRPPKLLEEGRFDKTLAIMTGHNQDEGSRFVPNTSVTDQPSYRAYLESLFPELVNDTVSLDYVTQTLYPPIFDGSQGYTSQTERSNLTFADAAFVSNTRSMSQASFLPTTYSYQFSGPPAVHGADLPFTFFDSAPAPGVDTTVAELLQRYITRFAETGQPNAPGLPPFPAARPGSTVQNLGSAFVGPIPDEGGGTQLSRRCRFWQEAPYLSHSVS